MPPYDFTQPESALAGLSSEADEYRRKQMEATALSHQPSEMTGGQVGAQAILGLLPLLIGGALKGREGISAGAEGGLLGSSVYQQQIKKKNEDAAKNSAALSVIYGDKAESADKRMWDLGLEGLKQENRIDLKERFPATKRADELDESQKEVIRSELIAAGMNPETASALKLETLEDANLAGKLVNWKTNKANTDNITQSQELRKRELDIKEGSLGAREKEREIKEDTQKLKFDERRVTGYDWIDNVVPSAKDAQEATIIDVETKKILAGINRLKKSVEENGQEYFGEEAVKQLNEMKVMMNTLRKLTGSGANYTAMEMALNKTIELAADVGIGQAMMNVFRGRDPLDSMNIFSQILRDNHKISMTGYGFKPKPKVISVSQEEFDILKKKKATNGR